VTHKMESRAELLLAKAFEVPGGKPTKEATRADKKRFSERLSGRLAPAIAAELRARGLKETVPAGPGEVGPSGAERRIAGGIGAKKVDVTWATEESGLLLAISIKSISFEDTKTHNYQKNLTNRRGDLLIEALTLHKRFPYAVLAGFLFFPFEADRDGTKARNSTVKNAHIAFKLFTGREGPAGREEQYERFYICLHGEPTVQGNAPVVRFFLAGSPEEQSIDSIFGDLIRLVAERNPDFYEEVNGSLVRRKK
jgi:hypothetical protein